MSVLSVQNMQETFVGAVGKARTATQVTDPNAAGYITDGEIVVVNNVGTVVSAGTASTFDTTPFIQIVERNGDVLTWSSKIPANGVMSYTGRLGAQGTEQIYHIGFNGASGALDVNAGLDFMLTVIENQDDMMWSEQKKKSVVFVPSNLVTTQLDLAKAVVKNQMKKYVTDGSSITAAMLNSASAADSVSQGQTLQVVHGSNLIVYNGAPTVPPVAGTVLRIGAAASGDGPFIPVYTVTGAGPIGNSFYLDMPYAGPTNSALPAVDHGYIAPGLVGVNWGVRFTGKALPFRRDFFKFKRVSFTLQMSGYGATPLNKAQEATYGYGDGRLVLEEESFSKGFEGALNRMTVPLPLANETFQASATTANVALTVGGNAYGDFVTVSNPGSAANLYDCIMIGFFSNDKQTVVASPDMLQSIKIFSPTTTNQNTAANTGIRPALNAFMNQARVGSFTNLGAGQFN